MGHSGKMENEAFFSVSKHNFVTTKVKLLSTKMTAIPLIRMQESPKMLPEIHDQCSGATQAGMCHHPVSTPIDLLATFHTLCKRIWVISSKCLC